MTTPLLTAKLYIPPPRPNLVPRPGLFQQMDEGLRLGRRLSLVSAPAGFGKTTLVAEWVCSLAHEVAWISLDEGDNDLAQFLTYLIAALQQVEGKIGRAVQQMLLSPQLPPVQTLVAALINDIAAAGTALVLVLDDLHLVNLPDVHQVLDLFLERQPPTMHLVISTRQDPPLLLHQLRARGQVTEIRERDLRFTAAEAADFMQRTMGLCLSAEVVIALEARTEGWVTGLQLAAIAFQSQGLGPQATARPEDMEKVQDFVEAFAGDDRYVADYLIGEVLQRQPEAVRAFLRQTAILDRLTAPLCDAVTGREDSRAVLDRLDKKNLFLIPLDHRREWYRYHRLFAEVLQATLDRETLAPLHLRAASWHEAHGSMGQAIQHALAYASISGSWEGAERLIGLAAEETIHSGGLSALRSWLDALPDERLRANGELATYRGWVLALSGEMALAEEHATAAEDSLRRTGAPAEEWGKLLALRSFVAVLAHQDYGQAIELSASALEALGEDQLRWRIMALWAQAESQERTREITEAIATLREAQEALYILGSQVFAMPIDLFLASALHSNGRRCEALAVCEEALARYSEEMRRSSPVVGLIYSQLGMLHYEANQLDLARHYLERGVALGERLSLGGDLAFSYGYYAPVLHALGETDEALEFLEKAYQLALQTGLTDTDWSLARAANIHLQGGDLAAAGRWAEAAGLSPEDELQYVRIESHLVYGRLLLAQGRLSDARRWLGRLGAFARERGLVRWLLTVQILQALLAERSGDRAAARECLGQSLSIAVPQDYYRAFLDEAPQISALLRDVRQVAPSFIDRVLEYAGAAGSGPVAAAQLLIEPLTGRELEVLGLIALGLSNRDIGERLFIATGTVKRHINNIYGKMGVRSRTQAIARARELGLL
jgi:LuxR family maltose regulon positive regulatory protein